VKCNVLGLGRLVTIRCSISTGEREDIEAVCAFPMSPQAILYAEDTIGHVRLHCDCSKCARRKDGGYGDIVDVGDLVNRLGVRNGCYWLLAGMQRVAEPGSGQSFRPTRAPTQHH
jgi:hypothetical protein